MGTSASQPQEPPPDPDGRGDDEGHTGMLQVQVGEEDAAETAGPQPQTEEPLPQQQLNLVCDVAASGTPSSTAKKEGSAREDLLERMRSSESNGGSKSPQPSSSPDTKATSSTKPPGLSRHKSQPQLPTPKVFEFGSKITFVCLTPATQTPSLSGRDDKKRQRLSSAAALSPSCGGQNGGSRKARRCSRDDEFTVPTDFRFRGLEKRAELSKERDPAVYPLLIKEEARLYRDYSDLLTLGSKGNSCKVQLVVCGAVNVGKRTLVRSLLRSDGPTQPPDDLAFDPHQQLELTGGGTFHISTVSGTAAQTTMLPLVVRCRRVVFVVVISLAHSRQERLNQLRRWLRFIGAVALVDPKPVVHVVLTHRDDLHQDERDASFVRETNTWTSGWGKQTVLQLKNEFSARLDVDATAYIVGNTTHCDVDVGLQRLGQALCESKRKLLVFSAGASLQVVDEAAAKLQQLRELHSDWPVVPEGVLWSHLALREHDSRLLRVENIRPAVLRQLQSNGEIVWLPEAMLVVLSPEFLMTSIIPKLSPDHIFTELESGDLVGTGCVTLGTLERIFGSGNMPHVLAIIKELDLGFECPSDGTLLLPALVNDKTQAEWCPSQDDAVLGRRLRLSASTDYFDELFILKLQVRLSRFFSAKPHLWVGGINGAKDGVQCFVMSTFDGQGIDVWATGRQGEEEQVHTVVLDLVDIVHRLRVTECVNLQPTVYALSQNLLRRHSLSCPKKVLGCPVADLERMEPLACVSPLHPSNVAQPRESVAAMLGHPPGVFLKLWPLPVLGIACERLRILIVRANIWHQTSGPVDSDNEERAIKLVIKHSPYRAFMDSMSIGAATLGDIRAAVHVYRPHVIHFAGHAGRDGMLLYLEGRHEEPLQPRPTAFISGEHLAELLRDFYATRPLALVVINGCEAAHLAGPLLSVARCVVCPTKTLHDNLGVPFAEKFYRGLLGGDTDVEEAFADADDEVKSLVARGPTSMDLCDPEYACSLR